MIQKHVLKNQLIRNSTSSERLYNKGQENNNASDQFQSQEEADLGTCVNLRALTWTLNLEYGESDYSYPWLKQLSGARGALPVGILLMDEQEMNKVVASMLRPATVAHGTTAVWLK